MRPAGILKPALILVLVFAALPVFANDESPLYRGPYLQMSAPTAMTIVWRTEGATDPVVRFGTDMGTLSNVVDGEDILHRVSTDVDAPDDVPRLFETPEGMAKARERANEHSASTRENTYQYEARITGLQPATRYYYAVYDGGRELAGGESYFFQTSPERGSETPTRVWVVGDSGTGGGDQKRVHQAMRTLVEKEEHPLDMYIHVGDMAYGDGTDYEFQKKFFEIYDDTLRNVVCWPAMGNHEGHTSRGLTGVGPYYDAYVVPTNAEVGGVASGTEAYYSFDVANVHFVCLDSHDLNRKPTGAMAVWLKADLEKTDADWLVAFWHHPPYTKGSHDSDREGQLIEMRTHIMPILEAGGVDLVLTGHSHIYERSMLMDGAYDTPTTAEGVILDDGDGNPEGDGAYRKSAGLNPHEGAVQIVSGHGGTGLSRGGTMPVMREIIVEHGSVLLDFDGDTLTGRMLDKHDEIRDLFSVVKRGEVNLEPIEDPWQPAPLPPDKRSAFIDFLLDTPGQRPDGFTIAAAPEATIEVIHDESGSVPRNRLSVGVAPDSPYALSLYDHFTGDAYEAELTYKILPEGSRQAMGLVFRGQDTRNYHFVRVDAARGTIDLVKVEDGVEELVLTRDRAAQLGEWQEIELTVDGSSIRMELDDEAVFLLDDASLEGEGRVGFRVEPGTEAVIAALSLERDW